MAAVGISVESSMSASARSCGRTLSASSKLPEAIASVKRVRGLFDCCR
jgi:hypothetical protein